jgi:hypothetical protein
MAIEIGIGIGIVAAQSPAVEPVTAALKLMAVKLSSSQAVGCF